MLHCVTVPWGEDSIRSGLPFMFFFFVSLFSSASNISVHKDITKVAIIHVLYVYACTHTYMYVRITYNGCYYTYAYMYSVQYIYIHYTKHKPFVSIETQVHVSVQPSDWTVLLYLLCFKIFTLQWQERLVEHKAQVYLHCSGKRT